jgi:hypothetical protein
MMKVSYATEIMVSTYQATKTQNQMFVSPLRAEHFLFALFNIDNFNTNRQLNNVP